MTDCPDKHRDKQLTMGHFFFRIKAFVVIIKRHTPFTFMTLCDMNCPTAVTSVGDRFNFIYSMGNVL